MLIIDEGLFNIDKENLEIVLNLLLNDQDFILIYILYYNDNIISSDQKGTIYVYSNSKNKQITIKTYI